jgi:hypothetical protein
MNWFRERALTLVLLSLFVACGAAAIAAGHRELNDERAERGAPALPLLEYVQTAHPWEAISENWESEFLEMMFFVLLTVALTQKGSPESRRPGTVELVDADPRDFRHLPGVPWPVRRGGWILWVYERSLTLALGVFFLLSWIAHALTGWRTEAAADLLKGNQPEGLVDFVTSSKFWFQTMQNWQSEFLGIATMVWLAVYLRQRGSPESKPVHASHQETGH